MPRDFVINGECLVSVKGGRHTTDREDGKGPIAIVSELGLSSEEISVSPRYYYQDWYVDDFGSHVPAEVQWKLADVTVGMTLIHYDPVVLDICLDEAMGGGSAPIGEAGDVLAPCGLPLGNGLPLFSSGCHYVSLNLTSQVLGKNWRFPASYLLGPPLRIPLSTKATAVVLEWRAIPYIAPVTSGPSLTQPDAIAINGAAYIPRELQSSGVRLWDHELDRSGVVG